jgi:mannose-6-phosphate isomerase-like protein (cupin superfamily)
MSKSGRASQMMHERCKPDAQSGANMLSRQGEEATLVKGRLSLEADGRRTELRSGDAYWPDSRRPRAFRNAGEGELVIVSVCAPPTFSAGRRPPM